MQPSLNELPARHTPPPNNEAQERKRPAAASDENTDPEGKPPKAKQPRTIEIELASSTTDAQDSSGMFDIL